MRNILFNRWFQKPYNMTLLVVSFNLALIYRKQITNYYMHLRDYFKPKVVKVKNIAEQNDEYIEKRKEFFLSKYKDMSQSDNENISKEFYNKDLFKHAMKNENNELEITWKRRVLMDSMPRGNIYMYYDAYKQGFAYYTDLNSVSYHLLNAVAMKYCMTFNCMDFFIDENIIPKEQESPLIKIHHKEIKKKQPKDKKDDTKDAPFARFKNYSKQENNSESGKKKGPIINMITNRFLNMGKVYKMNLLEKYENNKPKSNFNSPMLETLKGESQLQDVVMNYSDYKKLANK